MHAFVFHSRQGIHSDLTTLPGAIYSKTAAGNGDQHITLQAATHSSLYQAAQIFGALHTRSTGRRQRLLFFRAQQAAATGPCSLEAPALEDLSPDPFIWQPPTLKTLLELVLLED